MDSRPKKRFARRYPWEKWFARRGPFTLTRGRDFPLDVPAYSMAQMVRNRAGRPQYRLRLHITIQDADHVTVVVDGKLGTVNGDGA